MKNDKVLCQCCGKMMVPTVVRSRGLWISWGMRLDGHVCDSVCPFCLNENWDGGKRPQHRSMAQKTAILLGLMFAVLVIYGLWTEYAGIAQVAVSKNVSMVGQWAIILGAVLLYRKFRYK
ncbi:hypothetical protein QZH44_30160 (plasmid) [Pseudomonas corrugata]|uniref:hypothetical protein n=1 Tax=Pseudomonas corrugata TaxID=47879 RepID=UPI003D812FCB